MNPEFCPYPGLVPPIELPLADGGEHPCPYLPGRIARDRGFSATRMPAELYHEFMNSNFRRSGQVVYQPVCSGCRACCQIRVPIEAFRPNKSQRRCWRRNQDLIVTRGNLVLDEEKLALYRRYMRGWHGREEPVAATDLTAFLYTSPVDTVEYLYRDSTKRLLAVGICDVSPLSISSVYFYHDPDQASRGLGTFSAMCEVAEARRMNVPHLYLGFWIEGCRAMEYKSNFRPSEILHPDGSWRPGPA